MTKFVKGLKKQKRVFISFSVLLGFMISLLIVVISARRDTNFQQHASTIVPRDGFAIYDECRSYDPNCLSHLQKFSNGGFKVVMNYNVFLGANAQQVTAYANQAQAAGIKIIWSLRQPQFWNGTNLLTYFPTLAATCNCSDNPGFIQYLVSLVAQKSVTWGYYVGEEFPPEAHTQWKAFSDIVHQTDPNHPRLYMGGVNSYLYDDPTVPTFADGVEVLGQDFYPIGVDYSVPYTQTNTVAKAIQSAAKQTGKDAAMNIQALNWQSYYPPARCTPYPTCAYFPTLTQLQQMLQMAVNNSTMRLIFIYSYFDILRSDNPTGHWNDVVTALSTYSGVPVPLTLYDNGVNNPFKDITTTNPANYTYLNACDTSKFTISAPCSYAIAMKARRGLYWQTSTPLSLTNYHTLEWNMNISGQPITDFAIGFLLHGTYYHVDLTQNSIANTFATAKGGGWVHIVVPISQFNLNGTPITIMKLANITNTDLSTIYVDDMTLIP